LFVSCLPAKPCLQWQAGLPAKPPPRADGRRACPQSLRPGRMAGGPARKALLAVAGGPARRIGGCPCIFIFFSSNGLQ